MLKDKNNWHKFNAQKMCDDNGYQYVYSNDTGEFIDKHEITTEVNEMDLDPCNKAADTHAEYETLIWGYKMGKCAYLNMSDVEAGDKKIGFPEVYTLAKIVEYNNTPMGCLNEGFKSLKTAGFVAQMLDRVYKKTEGWHMVSICKDVDDGMLLYAYMIYSTKTHQVKQDIAHYIKEHKVKLIMPFCEYQKEDGIIIYLAAQTDDASITFPWYAVYIWRILVALELESTDSDPKSILENLYNKIDEDDEDFVKKFNAYTVYVLMETRMDVYTHYRKKGTSKRVFFLF
ncbi:hypothetical protein CYMTET_48154 [Cymbomonas tetramitiformis]|uniref:Uncharacterized protein n=1 Tax=Cymbomonas tetramitiformis TaxID=36881 RepID=A0AAE0EVF4_9CHLO|nr:hypothetical protein CYMTET_48154 [Cymbomonas tetramitiformis]